MTSLTSSSSINNDRKPRSMARKSRWNPESERITFPSLPLNLPTVMDEVLLKQYLRILRIEDITRKLRTDDVLPHSDERSLSPAPMYGSDGKRVNTREMRYRERLEMERSVLVEQAIKDDPLYRPPSDYKRPNKLNDRIFIPAKDFPDTNFIGLLIGPRGNTLKKIESESGAKISIRGKGAMKEGKKDYKPQVGENDDLHAVVMGETEQSVIKAVEMINDIIEEACSTPESQLELKRNQLRELAYLNGTLRDEMEIICQSCGESGHRRFECPHSNISNKIVCKICGANGHLSSDCRLKNDPETRAATELRNKQIDDFLNQI